MQVAYVEAGFPLRSLWPLTPREIAICIEAAATRRRREHDERMSLAWHTAALIRAKKKFPRLKDMQARIEPAKKPQQPWQDQLAIAMRWHAAVGPKRQP